MHSHDVDFATVVRQKFEAIAVKYFESIAFAVWITNVHGVDIDG
jgi:hypothetical protein